MQILQQVQPSTTWCATMVQHAKPWQSTSATMIQHARCWPSLVFNILLNCVALLEMEEQFISMFEEEWLEYAFRSLHEKF